MLTWMSTRASSVAPSVELLLATHVFPGEYIVKAFGPGDDGFRAAVQARAAEVVGADRVRSSERASRHGRKICITLTLSVETVDDVVRAYDEISRVPELLMLM
jgi:uncharacterized protein